MNNVVKLGLILASLSIVMSLLIRYVFDINLLFSWKFMLASLIINSLILIFLGRKLLRDPEEGRLGYGTAVKKLFLALIISSLVAMTFNMAFYSNDQTMKDAFEQYEMEMQEWGARTGAKMAGASEAEQEAAVEQVRQQREAGEIPTQGYPFTWSKFPITFASAAIGNLLFSLLIALFVKEKDTQFAA